MSRPVLLLGPEQGAGNLGLLDKLILELQVATGGALKGSHVFVPHLQVGDVGVETDAATWFTRVLEALNDATVLVAIVDGPQADENVAFLMGAAFAAGKPVIAYHTDRRAKGPLVNGAALHVAHDVRELAAALAKVLVPG